MVQAVFDRSGAIVGIASALRNTRVTPARRADLSSPVSLSDEEVIVLTDRDGSSGWSICISYMNAKGQHSKRRITCRKLVGYGDIEQVIGYCHETKAVKMFRVDCITELADMATGEIVDPFKHFADLRFRGLMKMQDKALDDFGRVLVFFAKCDGSYHPLEERAVEDALSRYCLRFGGDDETVESVLVQSRALAPDGVDLIKGLKRLSRSPQSKIMARLILDNSSAIINADGHHSPEEIEWGGFALNYLRKVADR